MELANRKPIVLPALRGVLGDWIFYSSLMSAKLVSEWIQSAKDIREAKSLDEILQRDLKERKKQIAEYLLKTDSRFFNSLVIGVYDGVPNWIEFDIDNKVNELNAEHDASIFESMGLLIFNGDENMFAIDGQHRVAGIKIAFEEELKKSSNEQVLVDNAFSVIFLAHIDSDLGRKRTRKLFSDINKNAKPVAQSDKIIIDEEDICAIVTRRIYGEYKYFKNGKLIDISPKSNIDKDNITHLTNIDNLYTISKILKKLFKKKKDTHDWDEENVLVLKKINEDFYEFMIGNIDEFKNFFSDNTTTSLMQYRKNNNVLIFRPVGLSLLAKLYVYFKQKNNLEYLKENINKIGFKFPESPLNNVLWNKGKMETKGINQTLGYDLCLYILNEYPSNKTDSLLTRYQEILKNDNVVLPSKIQFNQMIRRKRTK